MSSGIVRNCNSKEQDDANSNERVQKILSYFETKKITKKRLKKSIKYLRQLPEHIDVNIDALLINICNLDLNEAEKYYLYENLLDLIFWMDEPKLIADKVHHDASSKKTFSFLACKCLSILITEYDYTCSNFISIFIDIMNEQIMINIEDVCAFIIQIIEKHTISYSQIEYIAKKLKEHLLKFDSKRTYIILCAIYAIISKHTLVYDLLIKNGSSIELDVLQHTINPIKSIAKAIKYRCPYNIELDYDYEVSKMVINK